MKTLFSKTSVAHWAFVFCLSLLSSVTHSQSNELGLTIGSKTFTESVLLGELLTQSLQGLGLAAEHRKEVGGSPVLWKALQRGDIDIYPEYTGTLQQALLSGSDSVAQDLADLGLGMSVPLGFNNTYALGMRTDRAAELGISRISQLADHPQLQLGFSNEFMNRADGWLGLQQRYNLPQQARGLNHDLAYRGLDSGSLDVIDLYSTDAEIAYYRLTVLEDDAAYFPDYLAVYLYRLDVLERFPESLRALEKLGGSIDATAMQAMNAQVKLEGRAEANVAAEFLSQTFGQTSLARVESTWAALWRYTVEHLILVGVSLVAAILVALPLGVAAARYARFEQIILSTVGVIQTIPSLALFVFMIPLLGIGGPPAIVALFLYSLLPIVRNTHAGLTDIAPDILESAEALGLPRMTRLRLVELPLALPTILAGIKTSAVINIGTATLGALIGAGGYGQPILTGIRLDDIGLIMQGAIPAALLALAVQGLFELAERRWLFRGRL